MFVLLKGIAAALYDPARQSAIRMTVSEEQHPEAVTLSTISVNSMKIIGPSLGGLLIALYGVRSPYLRKLSGSQLQLDFWPFCLNLQKQLMTRYELKDGKSHINRTALLRASIHFSLISFFIIFWMTGFSSFFKNRVFKKFWHKKITGSPPVISFC
ncbi:MAG: MFS transporter [Bacillota bacterium]